MKCSLIVLVLVLNILHQTACFDPDLVDAPPVWSQQYTLKGVITHSNGEIIEEPFEAWYDGINKHFRVDFYGGVVSEYHLKEVGKNGQFYRIVPAMEVRKCQKTESTQYRLQTALPDLIPFEYNGTEIIGGRECNRFEVEFALTDGTFHHMSMWTQHNATNKNQKVMEHFPIRYEGKNIDAEGNILIFYKIDYESYEPSLDNVDLKAIFQEPMTKNEFDEFEDCEIVERFTSHFNRLSKFIYLFQSPKPSLDQLKAMLARYENQTNQTNIQMVLEENPIQSEEPTLVSTDNAFDSDDFPEKFDWRTHGFETSVRHQTDVCGSCWAHTAVGSIEGALFVYSEMNRSELVRLSEQALIDCSWEYGTNGCGSGSALLAFLWIFGNNGIPTDESYGKYKAMEGVCHANDSNIVRKAPIKGFIPITNKDPYLIKRALLKYGPISVGLQATERFAKYKTNNSNEVFYDETCTNEISDINHAVLIVGYGKTEHGEPYWIIKNSYGKSWGNKGYALISARKNHCGILTEAVYPVFNYNVLFFEIVLILCKNNSIRGYVLLQTILSAAVILLNMFYYIKRKFSYFASKHSAQDASVEIIELN